MKVRFLLMLMLLITLSITAGNWTIGVYLNGDNTLGGAVSPDVDEMEAVGSDGNIDIVVQCDGGRNRRYYYSDADGSWSTCRRYRVLETTSGNSIIDSPVITDLGELDSGDGNVVFRDFGTWAFGSYPADHTCIVIWNHGGSWMKSGSFKELLWDDTSRSSILLVDGELDAGMDTLTTYIGKKLDIFGIDACLSGNLEWAYQLSPYVNIMIASEETEGWDGWDYTGWLDGLKSNPTMSPDQLAAEQVYAYTQQGPGYPTMAALDMNTQLQNVIKWLDIFARELILAGGRGNTDIETARDNAMYYSSIYSDDQNKDLYDFAENIYSDASLPLSLREAAESLMAQFGYPTSSSQIGEKFLIAESHLSTYEGSHGVYIYYPNTTSISSYYAPDGGNGINFRLPDNTLWDEFLKGYTATDLSGIVNIAYECYGSGYATFEVYDPTGDYDGIPDPGETCQIKIMVRNTGGATATNVSGELSVFDNSKDFATVTSSTSGFPDIPGSSSKAISQAWSTNYFTFTVSSTAPVGQWVSFSFTITSDNDTTVAIIPMQIGVASENPSAPLGIYTTPLQVQFTDHNEVLLVWKTNETADGKEIVLEKAGSGSFESIYTVNCSHAGEIYTYIDREVQPGKTYYYRLVLTGGGVIRGGKPVKVVVPSFSLGNSPVELVYVSSKGVYLNVSEPVHISIFDITGREVKQFNDVENKLYWDWKDNNGSTVKNGIYFIKATTSTREKTIKLIKMI